MRTSMAYFAGAGTVLAAIIGGVGGGFLIADIISPQSPKQEMSLLERRMSHEPTKAAAPSLEPVPYLSAPQPSAPSTIVATAPVQSSAPTEAANVPAPAQPADTLQARQIEASARQAETQAPQPAAATAPPVVREQAAAPDDAAAKARGGEVRRAEDRRKTERRQQWTERRRYKPRQEQELIAVEERVREETEPRRQLAAEPVRIEMPQIRLFGSE